MIARALPLAAPFAAKEMEPSYVPADSGAIATLLACRFQAPIILIIPNVIYRSGAARVTAVRSTDPAFMHWPSHERVLRTYFDGQAWSCADSRSDALLKLRNSQSQIVYFYCHGGSKDGVPYLQVGSPEEMVITRDSLRFAKIAWDESKPLVFINGCKTAAVEPSQAIEFVSALIDSSASGVIGTEISLFEPLACELRKAFSITFFGATTLLRQSDEAV